jgi:hypothetical protein
MSFVVWVGECDLLKVIVQQKGRQLGEIHKQCSAVVEAISALRLTQAVATSKPKKVKMGGGVAASNADAVGGEEHHATFREAAVAVKTAIVLAGGRTGGRRSEQPEGGGGGGGGYNPQGKPLSRLCRNHFPKGNP